MLEFMEMQNLNPADQRSNTSNVAVMLTYKCQMACCYCRLDRKHPDMPEDILYKSIDLLFTSPAGEVELQFFGGEPLLRFDLIKKGIAYSEKKSKAAGKRAKYLLTTNGLLLDKKKLDYLAQFNVTVMLSVDGAENTQLRNRPLVGRKNNRYFNRMIRLLKVLNDKKNSYFGNMVFLPENIKDLKYNVNYLISLGIKDIQLAYAIGASFTDGDISACLSEFNEIRKIIESKGIRFRNFHNDNEPILSSPQITVSSLGSVYIGCALILEKIFPYFNDMFYFGELKDLDTITSLSRTKKEQLKIILENKKDLDPALLSNLYFGIALDVFFKYNFLLKKYSLLPSLKKDNECRNYLYHNKMLLMLTYKCQMACCYCRLDRKHPDMPEDILYKSIDLLFTSPAGEVELQFFGGEPLLRFDLIKKGIAYSEKKSKAAGKRAKYLLTTNGLLLDKKKLDYLAQFNVYFLLSIDGKNITQSLNRPMLKESRSYPFNRLAKKLELLQKRKCNFFVNIVVRPDNVGSLFENTSFFLEQGVKKIRFSYELGVFWEKENIFKYYINLFKIIEAWSRKSDFKIINVGADDEPSLASPVLTADYDGKIYCGCTIPLEKLFLDFRKANLIGDIKVNKDIKKIERSKIDEIIRVVNFYPKNSSLREITINNLILGEISDSFFNRLFVEEDQETSLKKMKRRPVNSLMVMCTYACQFVCTYCEVKQMNYSMPLKILYKTIDLLLTTQSKECQLRFWGGEPLLRWNFIRKGISYGQKRAQEKGKKIKFMITTNGLLLDKKKLDFLKKYPVEIMFSFDGVRKINDFHRFLKSREDVYNNLLVNLKLLIKSGLSYFVNSVITPTTVDNLSENIEFLKSLKVKKVQLGYQCGIFWPKEKIKIFISQLRKFIGKCNDSGFLMNFANDCEPTMLSNEILVDVDGKLYLDGAIFIEKDFPGLRKQYFLGDLKAVKRVDDLYLTKKDVFNKFKKVCNISQRKLLDNNVNLGLEMEAFYTDFSSRSFQSNEHPVLIPVLKSDLKTQQKILKKIGINSSFLYLDGTCGNKCIFCLSKNDLHYSDPFKSERLIEKNKDLKNNKLCIIGNDPLLHPDIVTIVESARRFHFKKIEIMTSGEVLADKGFTKKLIDSGVSSFSLPLYSDIAQIHDFIVGLKGSHPKVLKGVENVLNNKGKVFIHSNLLKQNLDYLKKLEGFVKNVLGSPFVILPVRPKSSNLPYEDLVPSYNDIVMKLEGVSSLMAFPLCIIKQVQENIFKDESEIADSMKLYVLDQKFFKPQKCRRCTNYLKCVGIFKEYGQMYGVEALTPFIRNGKRIS